MLHRVDQMRQAVPLRPLGRAYRLLPSFRAQIPASVSIATLYDRSVTIRDSIHDVKITLLITVGLVILVIFFFLRNLSATIIPSLAVPMSIVGSFAAIDRPLGWLLPAIRAMARCWRTLTGAFSIAEVASPMRKL